MATNTETYRSARDQLVGLIGDYRQAVDTFEWPRLTGLLQPSRPRLDRLLDQIDYSSPKVRRGAFVWL